MKALRIGLMAIVVVLGTMSVKAQTADEIIAKHIDAVGGRDLLGKIKTVYMEGVASVMGNDLPTKVSILVGKGFKSETTFNGSDIISCITDTSGWMINPLQGQLNAVSLPADAVKQGRSSLDARGELFNYKDNGFTDSLLGREDLQGVSTYKIKLSKKDMEITYLIDPTSYYILKKDIKTTIDGKEMTIPTTYSNYKKTDFGYVMAYTMGVNNMGYDVTLNYSKIDINKDLDPKIFMMPKQ